MMELAACSNTFDPLRAAASMIERSVIRPTIFEFEEVTAIEPIPALIIVLSKSNKSISAFAVTKCAVFAFKTSATIIMSLIFT